MSLQRHKRGIEASGFSIIIGLILLFLSAGVIFAAISYTSKKLDETYQVEGCRIANEVKFLVKEKSSQLLTSAEPVCNTIDKSADEKYYVPSSKYKQNEVGASNEIRDMIKNCWYIWLDGSKPNMFREYFSEGCFVCYNFKVKEGAKGLTSSSVIKSMEDAYYAKDTSDKCSSEGGFLRTSCNADENEIRTIKSLQTNQKCCIKKANECENRGGKCSEIPISNFAIYSKWSCPRRGQSCYVSKDSIYSYTRYIRESSYLGGDIFFMPQNGENEIIYNPGQIYSISFVSPNRKFCWKGDDGIDKDCLIGVGGYAIAGLATGGALYLIPASSILAASSAAVKYTIFSIGPNTILAGYLAHEAGILENLLNKAIDLIEGPITEDAPNFIVVSTLDDAKTLGCIIK